MADRDAHGLRGPVRTVRVESASFDPQTNGWGLFKQAETLVYDSAGQLEGRPREDAVLPPTFDERGRRTTVSKWPPLIPRQPGLEWGVSIPNSLADTLTRYDASGRPIEIVFRNAEQKSLMRIELTWDAEGRISRERVLHGEATDFPAALRALMGDVFATREYEYDQRGRVVELRSTMSGLSETLQTYSYDEHDNIVEEHYEEATREVGLGRGGRLNTSNETTSETWNRHEYTYDDRGNWIEKVNLQRASSEREFRRTSIQRRTITYYEVR